MEMIDYKDYKTGLTFKEVRQQLAREQRLKYAKGEYMFVTRATVLGRWHEIKQKLYFEEEKLLKKFCEAKI